jgi:hypothetical protein
MSKGLTLVEILLLSGVGLIIGIFLVRIFVSQSGVFYSQTAQVSEGINLNNIVSEVESSIKQAAQVAVSYPEVSPLYTSGQTTLILKLPAYNSSGPISNVYDFIVVTKDQTNPKILQLKVFPDYQSERSNQNKILTTILDSVNFEYLNNNNEIVTPPSATKVKMVLSLLSKTGSLGEGRSSMIITSLRNL